MKRPASRNWVPALGEVREGNALRLFFRVRLQEEADTVSWPSSRHLAAVGIGLREAEWCVLVVAAVQLVRPWNGVLRVPIRILHPCCGDFHLKGWGHPCSLCMRSSLPHSGRVRFGPCIDFWSEPDALHLAGS